MRMALFDQTRFWLPALAVLSVISSPLQVRAQAPDQVGPGAAHPPQGRPPSVIRQPPAAAVQPGGQPHAQPPRQGSGPVAGQPSGPGPGYDRGPAATGRAPDARYSRGAIAMRDYGGQRYRGRVGWEGGRWRHEVHNGRPGWWWDVGGVWYYYPEPMEGPPTYVSEDYADDVVYAPAAAYQAPPPVAYEPAPPPPPSDPDPGASALGGASDWQGGRRCRRGRDRRRDWRDRRCDGSGAAGLLSVPGQLLLPLPLGRVCRCRSALLLLAHAGPQRCAWVSALRPCVAIDAPQRSGAGVGTNPGKVLFRAGLSESSGAMTKASKLVAAKGGKSSWSDAASTGAGCSRAAANAHGRRRRTA